MNPSLIQYPIPQIHNHEYTTRNYFILTKQTQNCSLINRSQTVSNRRDKDAHQMKWNNERISTRSQTRDLRNTQNLSFQRIQLSQNASHWTQPGTLYVYGGITEGVESVLTIACDGYQLDWENFNLKPTLQVIDLIVHKASTFLRCTLLLNIVVSVVLFCRRLAAA